MVFISVEDFFQKTKDIPALSREDERRLAALAAAGDTAARETLIWHFLPLVASRVQRAPSKIRTLHTVYACIAETEKGVDRFNFAQDSETFVHHLSWRLRQCITRCIAEA